MTETATLTLLHDGASGDDAPGSEVILLGIHDPQRGQQEALGSLLPAPGWEEMEDVSTGFGGVSLPLAVRGTSGALTLPWRAGQHLTLLSHPWSGRVRIEGAPASPISIDLRSETTQAIALDPATGDRTEAGRAAVWQGRFRSVAGPIAAVVTKDGAAERSDAPADRVLLRATGQHGPSSRAAEVILLRAEPRGLGLAIDLVAPAARAGWTVLGQLDAGGRTWPEAVKGFSGTLSLPAGRGARLTLLRHPWSGVVEIAYGSVTARIDLYASETGTVEVPLDRLGDVAEAVARPAAGDERDVEVAAVAGSKGEAATAYGKRLERIDPDLPLALYVPRWRGVALSTEMLFEQTLPVPLAPTTHPDEIDEEDIDALAGVLLATGVRHFVISGGDLFNLRLIKAVQERAPDRRFDLLWHSNFLQMGEPHDWNLLRHWLHALRDGRVRRVGVVKAGLERWFQGLGIDALHVPNVVPIPAACADPRGSTRLALDGARRVADGSADEACAGGPRIGLWLSGSSPYRKTPLAALAAVTMLPGARLRAAGLDDTARRFVADAQVPFERLWPEALPRDMLHRQICETDLTLYVTLSECAPMLPLESFALGIPCLVGPASDLFRDDPALRERLVVEHPLSPAAIAEKAAAALRDRDEIIALYAPYHAALTARARAQTAALVA